jgi:hypothetical protein
MDLLAQKHDNVWVLGYRYSVNTFSNGIYMTFGDSVKITYMRKPMSIDESNAMLCDSAGQLLLIANGCYIETAEGQKVTDSAPLNPGLVYDLFCPQNRGYSVGNSLLFFPDHRRHRLVHLFHLNMETPAGISKLLHSRVLLDGQGSGEMVSKGEIVMNDTLDRDGFHAVKHANGRDWWIVAAEFKSNNYYISYFSGDTVIVKKQSIGVPTARNGLGTICFSPDGSKMARYSVRDDLRIFDFDRCTGTFSNPLYIPIDDENDGEFSSGLAFSADGRFLYAGATGDVYQWDMGATDIAASRTTLIKWDTQDRCPFLVSFAKMELGPDGRIYCRTADGQDCMHRIKSPEKGGKECGFQYRYYNFEYSFANLPHFPNFRLGPVDGSSCDTLGLDNHPLAGWRHDAEGLEVDFTSVSWYEPRTWQWIFGDGTGSTERNPQHRYAASGLYRVCLVVSNANGSDTLCRVIRVGTVSTNAEPVAGRGTGGLHPNPTSGTLRWLGEGVPAVARVYDVLGRLQQTALFEAGVFDVAALVPGAYFVQVLDENGHLLARQKVIRAREE